ncbi:MAG: response regulator transcription factor [Bacteroidales bacterium]|jgi:DNA-binding NarL/FixJ family response regulator|nr:response regulator transcription factor [Bacteroidales bacterium]
MQILIADDHAIVREGVKQIVKTLPEVTLIDEASDGAETYSKIVNTLYDLVIMDISMPGMSGLEILQKIKDKNLHTRILILSFYPQEQYAVRAFKLGASGYLSKDSAYEELTNAIRKIASGGKYVSSCLVEKILFSDSKNEKKAPHELLSERELQVMLLLARGRSVMEIAGEISISDKTVSTYRTRIMEKMDMKKNADLTMYAIKNNLIEL